MADSYLTLLEVLRSTLERAEESQKLAPDEPALKDLKRSLARTIAELDLRFQRSNAA